MAEPRVTGIRGVTLAVRDLDESLDFYRDSWGLAEVGRMGPSAWLRATGAEHHVLTLSQSPQPGLLAVRLAAPDKAAVDGLYAKAIAFGADVIDAPLRVPSLGVTATVMLSPRSPLPGTARSNVLPVAPLMAVPFLYH